MATNRNKPNISSSYQTGKRVIFISLFFFFVFSALIHAQLVFVYDSQLGIPLHNVELSNQSKTIKIYSDEMGIADLKKFGDSEIIFFKLTNYTSYQSTKTEIENAGFKISLSIINSLSYPADTINEALTTGIANKIVTVSGKEIGLFCPQTSIDLLTHVNEIFTIKSQLSGGDLMIRGFGADNIIFYVDGINITDASYLTANASNFLLADVNSLSTTQVIIGAATVQNDCSTSGGAVFLSTPQLNFSQHSKWTTTFNGLVKYSSADFEKTVHADMDYFNNKWSVIMSFTYSDFDNLVMGNKNNNYAQRDEYVETINNTDTLVQNNKPNEQVYSGYNQMNFITKIGNRFNKFVDWEFAVYLASTSDVPRYEKLIEYSDQKPVYALWNYKPMLHILNSLVINFKNSVSAYDSVSFVYSYLGTKEENELRKYQSSWLDEKSNLSDIFSGQINFNKTLKRQNYLQYGVEFTYSNTEVSGNSTNISTGEAVIRPGDIANGDTKSVEAEFSLLYRRKFEKLPLLLIGGCEYNFENLRSEIDYSLDLDSAFTNENSNNNAFSATVGMIYQPGNFDMKLKINTGLFPADPKRKSRYYVPVENVVIVPNFQLEPQLVTNYDFGINFNLNESSNINLDFYTSVIRNTILLRNGTINGQDSVSFHNEIYKVMQLTNTGISLIYGISGNVKIEIIPSLSFYSFLSFTSGYDSEEFPLNNAPPIFGSTGFIFKKNFFVADFSAEYNGKISFEKLAPEQQMMDFYYAKDENGNPYSPAWYTLNLRTAYDFNEIIRMTFAMDNLLNYRYRRYASGITAPGFNVKISLLFSI